MAFVNKKIAIGVAGGIAAYKTCELIRELKKHKAEIRVAMTESARKFVTELTLATLSENPVSFSLFEENETSGTVHIDLARWCDILVICPATANVLGRVAAGLADDFLTTTILATNADVLFCPSMNSVMLEKQVVQENIGKLKRLGYQFVEPEWGALATTSEGQGWGRLASIHRIVQKIKLMLYQTKELAGKKVLVTAGPTREPIDPVRFITNYSTGKMGFALAAAAKLKGADVVLISGDNQLEKPDGVKYIEIKTVNEMKQAVEAEYSAADVLLMAAAVSDYKPKEIAAHKIKKGADDISLELQKTPDILASLSKKKQNCFHVGFALETENGIENAKRKLAEKKLDMIVLNNPLEPGSAFGGDTNIVSIIRKNNQVEDLPKLSKSEVAELILNEVCLALSSTNKKSFAV